MSQIGKGEYCYQTERSMPGSGVLSERDRAEGGTMVNGTEHHEGCTVEITWV